MIKTGKTTGSINGVPRYPNSFLKIQKDIERTPLHTRVFHIRDETAEISQGKYVSVARIVNVIIASDYKFEVLDAARKVMLYISSDKLDMKPFEKMGFVKTPEPFFLGALFEVLPQPIAVELFWRQYSLDKRESAWLAQKNAGETLLCFSEPVKAAEFMLALNQADRKGALEILGDLQKLIPIKKGEFRNYKVERLLKELPTKIFPKVEAKPKKKPQKAGKKTQKKKKEKKTKLPHPPLPNKDLIKISQKRPETNLADVKEYADTIREGYRSVAFHILEIVVGTDFHPEIMTAARKALFPIEFYRKNATDRPFQAFGFPPFNPAFYLGALFELLRPSTAVDVFKAEFLKEGEFYKKAFIIAGKSLLRFSAPNEAAKFARALGRNTNIDLERFFPRCQNNYNIRDYPSRRYDVEDLRRLLKI
ncbi:MAG: hypothetical protein V3T21_05545 [Candidatus Margulisiibacteriota bacterium]